jgi:hypothetical protein
MDRGYTDYALFGRWTMVGVYFVTLLKDNAAVQVDQAAPADQSILRHQ